MTPFLIVPIAFLMLFIVAIYFSFKRIAALRQVLNARIESLSQEQSRLLRRLDGVDEKTTERTKADYETVSQKFADAIRIAARGRDQDFARAGRVLDNTQTKLENAHARLDRFNERIEAKLTRQAEAEQRRAEAKAQKTRTGSFKTPQITSSQDTDWRSLAAKDRGVCFFCARPALTRELIPATARVEGSPKRVLACPDCYAILRNGSNPPIRAFVVDNHYVPWYVYPDYDPFFHYYAWGYADPQSTINLVSTDSILPENWAVSEEDWHEPDYAFSPDSEAYRDYFSEQSAAAFDAPQGAEGFSSSGEPSDWNETTAEEFDADSDES